MDVSRKSKFETMMQETREDISRIDNQIERELAEVKERLAVLNNEKKAQLVIYGGFCQLLGKENDLSQDEEDEE